MKPKEGTILTVAKGMSDKALEMASKTDDIEEFAREVIAYGDYVLDQTPEMLPVLKQAGVVDSGGQGLMQVVKGAFDGLTGRMADVSLDAVPEQKGPAAQKPQAASLTDMTRRISSLDTARNSSSIWKRIIQTRMKTS